MTPRNRKQMLLSVLAILIFCLVAILFIVQGIMLSQSQQENQDKEKLAYKRGWIDCSIDYMAIEEFHSRADHLDDDSNDEDLSRIWDECIANAARGELNWLSLTREQQLNYDISPYWKRGDGPPRRLSRKQQDQILKRLQGLDPDDDPNKT